ncbi:hypothetical protein RFI_23897, partial [Reticulomyxa filosa]
EEVLKFVNNKSQELTALIRDNQYSLKKFDTLIEDMKVMKLTAEQREKDLSMLRLLIEEQQKLKTAMEIEKKEMDDNMSLDDKQIKKKPCEEMVVMVIQSPTFSPQLKNGVDFLLVSENNKTVKLKNHAWNKYPFGMYLLGENITVTVDLPQKAKFGHLKVKTSHLWIKHHNSTIDCSGLGGLCRDPTGDFDDTLLKRIICGRGSNTGGRGGGAIEMIIEQQLVNQGIIRANGGSGGGGAILIILQSKYSTFQHILGHIHCHSGMVDTYFRGRIAIYGTKLSSEELSKIDPVPVN